MARLPRLSVADHAHVLVQRGHEGQPVFRDEVDRKLFAKLLGESARAEQVTLHAYALHDDHIRLLATPATATGLSRLMQTLGRRYGTAFNRRHERRGSLWEGRFRATVIEAERYLLPATLFIELEPPSPAHPPHTGGGGVMASSLAHHLGTMPDPLVSDHPVFWRLGNTPFERDLAYGRLVEQGMSFAERRELADAVERGWPLGSKAFVDRLSTLTTRRLAPLKRGRPLKVEAKSDPIK